MNNFGWDLPPGVSDFDLPGNEESDEFYEGYDAYEDHKRYDECPYKENSKKFDDWHRGYSEAHLYYSG